MLAGWITTSNSSSGGASWRESMGRGEEIRREFCGWDFNTQGKVLLKLVYKCKLVIAESARLTTLFKFALAGSGQQYVECGAEIGYGTDIIELVYLIVEAFDCCQSQSMLTRFLFATGQLYYWKDIIPSNHYYY